MACQKIPGATLEERAVFMLPYVQEYRLGMPAGTLLAIGEHESGGWTKFLGIEVKACGAMGRAIGPWQVMSSCLSSYNLTESSACDPEASTREVCRVLKRASDAMLELVPEAANDFQLYSYLLYVAHNAGRAGMTTIINRTLAKASHPIKVDDVRPVAAAYVGKTARESGYLDVSLRAAEWQAWVGPVERVGLMPSAWAAPVGVTLLGLVALTLGAAIYLEAKGSRSRYLHWSPA